MSSLESLVVDENEVNEEILTETLEPYLRIGKQNHQLIFEPEFEEKSAVRQVAIALLAVKAMHELDFRESDQIGPSEIAEITGISKGTVYPKVRELESDNLVASEEGNYWVPAHNIQKIKRFIKEG